MWLYWAFRLLLLLLLLIRLHRAIINAHFLQTLKPSRALSMRLTVFKLELSIRTPSFFNVAAAWGASNEQLEQSQTLDELSL